MSYRDYLKSQKEKNGDINKILQAFQALKQEYKENPTPTKKILLEAKRKQLRKKGINMG